MTLQEIDLLNQGKMIVDLMSDEACKQIIEDNFPHLIEKENLHDRVEQGIIKRLTKVMPKDSAVSQRDYDAIISQVEGVIINISRERIVMGFTPEDLESFMKMKVYQVLSRKQYDYKRPAKTYFQFIFKNLVNDINRGKDSALKECDVDALSDCLDLNKIKGQDFLDEL